MLSAEEKDGRWQSLEDETAGSRLKRYYHERAVLLRHVNAVSRTPSLARQHH